MNWFKKIVPSRIKTKKSQRVKSVPEGVWVTCDQCKAQIYRADLERNLHVCNKCDHHIRISARYRLSQFFDEGTSREYFNNLISSGPMKAYFTASTAGRTAFGKIHPCCRRTVCQLLPN